MITPALQFLNVPGAAALGALIALFPLIVLLYFLKLKRQEQLISSTWLWHRTVEDLRVNAPFQRIRKNLLLLLQLLILAGLLFAWLRPAKMSAERGGKYRLLLIDTSASMNARDVPEGTRLDAAKMLAVERIEELLTTGEQSDLMAICSFNERVRLETPFVSDRNQLRKAVERIKPTYRATDFSDAAKLVNSLLSDKGSSELYIISDGRFEAPTFDAEGRFIERERDVEVSEDDFGGQDVEESVSESLRKSRLLRADQELQAGHVVFVPVGKCSNNVGITGLAVMSSPDNPKILNVHVRFQNFDVSERIVPFRLYFEDVLVESSQVVLPAGREYSNASFMLESASEGLLRAVVDVEDDLPEDNEVMTVLVRARPVRVLLVSSKRDWILEKLFDSDDRVVHDRMDSSLFAARDTSESEYDVVIINGQPAEFYDVPMENTIYMNCAPPADEGFTHLGSEKNPQIYYPNESHPVMRAVGMDMVTITEAMKIAVPRDAVSLLEGSVGPLISARVEGQRRIIHVGFNIYKSSWPLTISFPIFYANALRWLAGAEKDIADLKFSVGQMVELPRDFSNAETATVILPDQTKEEVRPQPDGSFYFTHTEQLGLYRVEAEDAQPFHFAINLMNPRGESFLMPEDEADVGGARVAGSVKMQKRTSELWKYLAVAAFAILCFEWYIFNRRVYV
ncbi:MAG: VWA domain-containing protein [Planctomycetota bacterium]|jgi:hypothetical protein